MCNTENDSIESDNEVINDDICQNIGPDETRISTVLTSVEEQTAVLKKMCKVNRYQTNDECLKDVYDGGGVLMENVIAEQATSHTIIKRGQLDLIHIAVSFFVRERKQIWMRLRRF